MAVPRRPRQQRRVTMTDVAREADVSVMSVSYTYNQPARVSTALRERVLATASRLGYQGPDPAARSLVRGRTGNVAVVVGEGLVYAFDDPGSSRFLAGVASVCVEERRNLVLLPASGDPDDVDAIRSAAVDAYILWTGVGEGPLLDALLASGRPLAIQGDPPLRLGGGVEGAAGEASEAGVTVVTIDDEAAARAAARVTFRDAATPAVVSFPLAPGGTARVVSGIDLDEVSYCVARARLAGIRSVCAEMGIDWNRVRVVELPRNDRAEAQATVTQLLTGADRPDAVVAMSDQLAMGVMDTATSLGLDVPADLRVSGWDDIVGAEPSGLTTIRQSLYDQGVSCARAVLSPDKPIETPQWELVVRRSTGPASHHRTSPRRGRGPAA